MRICLCFVASLVVGSDPSEPIERKAIEQRKAITKASMTLTIEHTKGIEKTTRKLKYWTDGERVRVDDYGAGKKREIACIHCERSNHYVWFNESNVGTPRVALCLYRLDEPGPHLTDDLVFDFRALGVVACPFMLVGRSKVGQVLLATDRTNLRMEETKWNGIPAKQLSFTLSRPWKPQLKLIFVPEMGGNVVYSEAVAETNGKPGKDVLESELATFGKEKIWFPKKLSYKEVIDEKVQLQEVVSVEDITLNEAIPAEIFKLIGMALPNDLRIHTKDPALGQLKWDGKAIVPLNTDFGAMYPDLAPSDSPRSSWWLAFAGGLGVVGFVCLWLFLRRGRNAA
jgi:hypothetical protein